MPLCVNDDWLSQRQYAIFNRSQNRHPLTDRQKLAWVIMSTASTAVQNLVEFHPYGASGQISET